MDLTAPLRRGDVVTLTIGTWTHDAMIVIASENGRSLIAMFDGMAPLLGGMYNLGSLLIYQRDDGAYVELITRTPVAIVRNRPI